MDNDWELEIHGCKDPNDFKDEEVQVVQAVQAVQAKEKERQDMAKEDQ